MLKFPMLDKKITISHRSKEIGFVYHQNTGPRPKVLNLFAISPSRNYVAFGLANWKALKISENTYQELEKFSRKATSIKWADDLLVLLKRAVSEIKG
jgi:hypothetical protein